MVYLGEPGEAKIKSYEDLGFINRSLWQKIFGVKCPRCNKKMTVQICAVGGFSERHCDPGIGHFLPLEHRPTPPRP